MRGTPVPDESAAAIQIERTISAVQAKEFDRQGARPVGREERLRGFAVQAVLDRLSRVTERPALHYRAYVYTDRDPNAAALADGRTYLSTGMLEYLGGRGSRADEPLDSSRASGASRGTRSGRMPSEVEAELAFILGHELAHTVAQHLVKRYRMLQQQQVLIALVDAGTAAVTRDASAGVQQAGRLALDAASLLRDVANSGYSQEQELEADQLGIRYVIKAGYDPSAALDVLEDFEPFDSPSPFLRTHPYIAKRREDLRRYLTDTGHLSSQEPVRRFAPEREIKRQRLREAQKLYPAGSTSWKNLQRQIEALD